jgi:short subunit dehydrogenase-like uncharacterized protein
MSGRVLLYGATGYTGRMLADALATRNVDLILAGRTAPKPTAANAPQGLPFRVFGLAAPAAIDAAIADVDVVLHCAGPFVDTGTPMMDACLRCGVHYLDLAGEWPVFAEAMARDMAAKAAGVMMMPGVGFTVVATDCLLALAAARVPEVARLRLAVSRPGVITRGTVTTAAAMVSPTVLVRRRDRLETAPAGRRTHDFDFGQGLTSATLVSWPDVITGAFTTGVGDIEVYSEADWATRLAYRLSAEASVWTGAEARRAMSRAFGRIWPEGPSAAGRSAAGFVLVAEAIDPWRRSTTLRMTTRDGYTVSVITACEIVDRVLGGQWAAGFRTPASVYGGDFILGLDCASLDAPLR